MKKSTKRIAVGTAIFGAIGYVAGILTAPKSGSDTRSSIRNGADKTMLEAEKQLKRLHTELGDVMNQLSDLKDDASDSKSREVLIGEVMDKASRTRQKTREILSALHDGNADDKDLKNAVKDASKAVSSLRSYLKK